MVVTAKPSRARLGSWARPGLAALVAVCAGVPLLLDPGAHGRTVAVLCVATVAGFAVLIWTERYGPPLHRRVVALLSATLLTAAVIPRPRGSSDLWQYAMYGRMRAVYHVSPYSHVPAEFADDQLFALLNPIWHDTPSLYGPGFTALSGALAWLTDGSQLATRLSFQLLAALAVAAAAVLVDRWTRDPMAVLLLVANPLVLYWTVNAGHNDALVGLALLLAVLAVRRHGVGWAGVAVGAAVLVKPVAGIAMVAIAWWLWRRRSGADDRGGGAAVGRFAGAALATTAVGFLLVDPLGAIRVLRQASAYTSWTSFWRPVALWSDGNAAASTSMSLVALALVAGVGLLAVAAHARCADPGPAVVGVILAFLLAAPYTMVWYVAWVAALVAVHWRTRLGLLALAFVAAETILVNRFFAGVGAVGGGPAAKVLYVAEAAALVALVAISVGALRSGRLPPVAPVEHTGGHTPLARAGATPVPGGR